MKRILFPVLALGMLPGFSQKQKTIIDPIDKYVQVITTSSMKEKLTSIASAEMQGRETASPGQRKAAAFLESQFLKYGLLPGTTGGYQMQFPIFQDTIIEAIFKVNGYEQSMDSAYSFNIGAAANGNVDIKQVVFASYGMVTDSRNDYAEIDVKGKWVMLLEGTASEPGEPTDNKSPFAMKAKIEKAKSLGARGVIAVSDAFPKKSSDTKKSRMSLKKPVTAAVTLITVSTALGHVILNMDPNNLLQNLSIIPTGDYNTNLQLTVNKRTLMLQSSNVLAILPGTDKKDEYVVITAHYDHLGVRGKDIYYGADDDGSGTTAVIQLAEAFSRAKADGVSPRRSIVFLLFSGEEKGLIGSDFFTTYPSFPLAKTSANLNIDMVGRIDPKYKGDSLNYLFVIGDDKLSTDLKPMTDSINKKYLNLQLDRRYNDPADPNRFYYRSDHYNFAKNGVPCIFYFNGTHFDYHKPTDTVDKINFDLMSKRVKLVYYTAWNLANRDNMMKRDIPLTKPVAAE